MRSGLVISEVKKLVRRLVDGNIEEIVALSQQGRVTPDEIEIALSEYPGRITMPPDEAFSKIVIYASHGPRGRLQNGEFNLWYDDEKSDLTLSFVVTWIDEDSCRVEISDIHVL